MDLVGRDVEISDLRVLLDTAACAVVVGPPGIGKTALASALGSCVWVGLEDAVGAGALQDRLARALDAPVDNPDAVLEALTGAPLLVLDGIEGVEDAVHARLSALVERAPVLVTSRQRPVFEAPVVELGPLSDAAGAILLRSRVQSVRQAAALEESQLQALSAALDGIPLALELAATRLRLYAPKELLKHTLAQLQDPRRPPRQQLLDVVEASWSALSETAREVLAVASMLPGTFGTDLLAAAAGRPVEDPLLEVLDASMLHPLAGVSPRFRVLAPIREVAAAALSDAERQSCLKRLATSVLEEAEAAAADLDGPLRHPSARILGEVVPVLRCLLDSTDPVIRLRAARALAARERRTGPMQAIVDRAALLPDEGPAALRVAWAIDVANAACHLGLLQVAADTLDRIEPLVDDVRRAEFLSARGSWLSALGRHSEAIACAQEAIALDDDPVSWFGLGAILIRAGDLAGALTSLERASSAGSAFRRAQIAYARCVALRDSGAPPDLVQVVADAASAVTDARAYTWLVPRLGNVRGVLAADRGDLDEARRSMQAAAISARTLGEPDDALVIWIVLQTFDLIEHRIPQVLLQPVSPEPGERVQAMLDVWRAVVHALLGHHAAAEALGSRAIERLEALAERTLVELATTLAVALGPGRPAVAERLLEALPVDDPLVQLGRQALQGGVLQVEPRVEHRVLAAIVDLQLRQVRVADDGSGFVALDGVWVDISRRRVLRRVLAALAGSDQPLDVDGICEATWPGEQLVGDSGTRRVHVAISTLRGLGLHQAITTRSTEEGVTSWQLRASVAPRDAIDGVRGPP